jgi:hypothetical protein
VLVKAKSYNHSLSFILRVCQPRSLQAGQLCLAFKYKFHKDRVGDQQIKAMVEKVLKEVYGAHLTIEAMIDENIEIENGNGNGNGNANGQAAGDDMVNNLLKTFGGKVVN